jgi:t-SNARE complex subunit (syntaxin)
MAKENKTTTGFVNPFEAGVSFESFINAVGSSSVAEYLKGQIKDEVEGELREFDEADIKWLEKEIKNFNYNAKNKEAFLKQAEEDHKKLILGNKPTL